MNFEITIPKNLEARVRRDAIESFTDLTDPKAVHEAVKAMMVDFRQKLIEKVMGVRYRYPAYKDEIVIDKDSEAAINQLTQYQEAVAEMLANFKVILSEAEKKRLLRTYRQAFLEKLEGVMAVQAHDDAVDFATEVVITIVQEADKEIQ